MNFFGLTSPGLIPAPRSEKPDQIYKKKIIFIYMIQNIEKFNLLFNIFGKFFVYNKLFLIIYDLEKNINLELFIKIGNEI